MRPSSPRRRPEPRPPPARAGSPAPPQWSAGGGEFPRPRQARPRRRRGSALEREATTGSERPSTCTWVPPPVLALGALERNERVDTVGSNELPVTERDHARVPLWHASDNSRMRGRGRAAGRRPRVTCPRPLTARGAAASREAPASLPRRAVVRQHRGRRLPPASRRRAARLERLVERLLDQPQAHSGRELGHRPIDLAHELAPLLVAAEQVERQRVDLLLRPDAGADRRPEVLEDEADEAPHPARRAPAGPAPERDRTRSAGARPGSPAAASRAAPDGPGGGSGLVAVSVVSSLIAPQVMCSAMKSRNSIEPAIVGSSGELMTRRAAPAAGRSRSPASASACGRPAAWARRAARSRRRAGSRRRPRRARAPRRPSRRGRP